MANKFYFTLLILPNILEFASKHLLWLVYGYYVEIMLVTVSMYALNFFIISYFLHKWFVKGEGDVKDKTKNKIKKIQQNWDQYKRYLD